MRSVRQQKIYPVVYQTTKEFFLEKKAFNNKNIKINSTLTHIKSVKII